jgi:hypothetical protein
MNTSGPISLAGPTAGQSIAIEVGQTAVSTISLNDTIVRTLAGVPSGAITMPTNFYGKRLSTSFVKVFQSANAIGLGNNTCRYDSSGNMYVFLRETALNSGYLYKFNTNYNLLWQKQISTVSSGFVISFDVKGTEIFIGGSKVGYPGYTATRPFVTKLDTNGTVTATNIYQVSSTGTSTAVPMFSLIVTDNGYVHFSCDRVTNIGWAMAQTSNLAVAGNVSVRNTGYRNGFVLNPTTNQVLTTGTGGTNWGQWLAVSAGSTNGTTTQIGFASGGGGSSGPLARNPTTGEIFTGVTAFSRYSSSYVVNLVRQATPSTSCATLAHNGTYLFGMSLAGLLTCFDNNLNAVWQKQFSSSSGAVSMSSTTIGVGGLAIASDGELLIPLNVASTPRSVVLLKVKADGSQLNSLNVTVGGINIQSVNVTAPTMSNPAYTLLTDVYNNVATSLAPASSTNTSATSTTTVGSQGI